MTREQLLLAQYLLGTYQDAMRHAMVLEAGQANDGRAVEGREPGHRGDRRYVVGHPEGIALRASRAFLALTGRPPDKVHLMELSVGLLTTGKRKRARSVGAAWARNHKVTM